MGFGIPGFYPPARTGFTLRWRFLRQPAQPAHQQLVDAVVVHVDDLEAVATEIHPVGAAGDLAQVVHHEAGNGLVMLASVTVVDVEHAHHVGGGGGTIHQPGLSSRRTICSS
jgi:hypothetical protein